MFILLATQDGVYRWQAGGEARRVLEAGRTVALTRAADSTLYAGAPERVFRSEDGEAWRETAGRFPAGFELSSLAAHPTDPETLLAGLESAALCVTRDGGESWTEDPAIRELAEAPGSGWHVPWGPAHGHVREPVFDPTDPRRIYLPIEVGGVVRTEDGGDTWENVHGGIHDDVHGLAVNPVEPRILYAVTRHGFGRSEDYGRTWRSSNRGLTKEYCRALAVDPRDGLRLYTAGAPTPPGTWDSPEGARVSLFRSEDGGESWRVLGGGLPEGIRGYVDDLALAPDDLNAVYFCNAEGELWGSADAGESWRLLARTPRARRVLVV